MRDEEEARRQQFYNSKAWELFRAARAAEQLGIDIYEYYTTGKIVEAENYHHIQEITEAWGRRLDAANVIGLSEANHRRIHKEYERSYKAKRKMQMILYAMLERFYREFVLDGGIRCFALSRAAGGTTALTLAAARLTVTITPGTSTRTLARASAVTYGLFRLSKLRLTSKDYYI